MATVLDISMSLDGYVAGKHDGLGHGLGDNGEPIHNWVMGGEWTSGGESFAAKGIDRELLDTMLVSAGSRLLGVACSTWSTAGATTRPGICPCLC